MSSQSESTNQASWFLYLGGEEPEGPFTKKDLMERIQSGGVGEQVYVWRKGFSDWMPFAEAKELHEGLAPQAPPPLPTQEKIKEDTASGISGVNMVSPQQLEDELKKSDENPAADSRVSKTSPELNRALQSFQSQASSQQATDLHTNTSIRSVRKSGLFGGFINIGGKKAKKNEKKAMPESSESSAYSYAHPIQKSGPRMIQKGSSELKKETGAKEPKDRKKPKRNSSGLQKVALLFLLVIGGFYVLSEYGYLDSILEHQGGINGLNQKLGRSVDLIPGGKVIADFAEDTFGISLGKKIEKPEVLNASQFKKLQKAAEADLSEGLQFALELGPDPLNPVFFLANNAPMGTVLKLNVEGQKRKLIGIPSYEKKIRKMVLEPLLSFQLSQKKALAPGHYRLAVSLSKGQTPEVTKALEGVDWQKVEFKKDFFIKGKLKQPFDQVLNNYLAKLDQKVGASSGDRSPASDMRLVEVQQLVSTLRSVSKSVSDSLFKVIDEARKKNELSSQAVMAEWKKTKKLWSPIMDRLKKLSTKVNPQNQNEFRYSQAYLDSADWLKEFEGKMKQWEGWIERAEWEKLSRAEDSALKKSLSGLNQKLTAIEKQLEEKSLASGVKEQAPSTDK